MKMLNKLVGCALILLSLSLVTACGDDNGNDDVYNEVVVIKDGEAQTWFAQEGFDGDEFEIEITSSNNGVIVNPYKIPDCGSSGGAVKLYNKNCYIGDGASIDLINPVGGGDELVRIKIKKK
jgi:hypothetical protein